MKIGVLTSSRADYGIYQPLLRRLHADPFFDLEIIAFGTHLSRQHGYTLDLIKKDGFAFATEIENMVLGDTGEAISTAMGLTSLKFSGFWNSVTDKYDLVFCLGDRYEMFSAVSAAIPFNITFAHIHGGEKTLGAIDNTLRHCITQMCRVHFTTTEMYANRVSELLESEDQDHIYNVGSLSLDNLKDIELYTRSEFKAEFNIDLNKPAILFTWHPETVNTNENESMLDQVLKALTKLKKYQIVLTMPNADTMGSKVRSMIQTFAKNQKERVHTVESFGIRGYFSCMEECTFVMGNSSSGIIEAASFNKYVLNIGDRQKGRATGKNVFHADANQEKILPVVHKIENLPPPGRENIYYSGGAADKIIKILKSININK